MTTDVKIEWRVIDPQAPKLLRFGDGNLYVAMGQSTVGGRKMFGVAVGKLSEPMDVGADASAMSRDPDYVLTFPTFEQMRCVWQALVFGDRPLSEAGQERVAALREKYLGDETGAPT